MQLISFAKHRLAMFRLRRLLGSRSEDTNKSNFNQERFCPSFEPREDLEARLTFDSEHHPLTLERLHDLSALHNVISAQPDPSWRDPVSADNAVT